MSQTRTYPLHMGRNSEFSAGEPFELATPHGTATIYPDGFFAHITVPAHMRGVGNAHKVMDAVTQYMDQNSVTLRTNPDPGLESLFEAHGFVPTDELTGYRDDLPSYVRRPHAASTGSAT